MSEPKFIKLVTAIATLMAGISSVLIAFYGLYEGHWGLSIVCLIISVIFGYFSWLDYQKLIANKTVD